MTKIEVNWIREGITQETVDWAQETGKRLADGHDRLSTSQLRKFFGELRRIQALGYENAKSDFILLQAKLAYTVARQDRRKSGKIKEFSEIISGGIREVHSSEDYKNFIDVVEALVAYHKMYENS